MRRRRCWCNHRLDFNVQRFTKLVTPLEGAVTIVLVGEVEDDIANRILVSHVLEPHEGSWTGPKRKRVGPEIDQGHTHAIHASVPSRPLHGTVVEDDLAKLTAWAQARGSPRGDDHPLPLSRRASTQPHSRPVAKQERELEKKHSTVRAVSDPTLFDS